MQNRSKFMNESNSPVVLKQDADINQQMVYFDRPKLSSQLEITSESNESPQIGLDQLNEYIKI